jgi:hypothetical protein
MEPTTFLGIRTSTFHNTVDHAGHKELLHPLPIDLTLCLEIRTQLQLVLMLKLLLTAELEEAVREATQEAFMSMPSRKVSQTLHVSNMLPTTHRASAAKQSIDARTAPGHHAPLARPARTNAGLLSTRATTSKITTESLESLK